MRGYTSEGIALRDAIASEPADRTVCGYLAGVTSGAVSVPAVSYLWVIIERSITGVVVPPQPMTIMGWVLVFFSGLMLICLWIVIALVLALPLFVPAYWIACRFRFSHWLYYVLAGAFAGVPLALALCWPLA